MIPSLADLKAAPSLDVIRTVVEHLRDGAEDIRQRQDAMVSAQLAEQWSERHAATWAVMQATADMIGTLAGAWIRDRAFDVSRRRDGSPANLAHACADIARSGLIAMRMRQDGGEKQPGEAMHDEAA